MNQAETEVLDAEEVETEELETEEVEQVEEPAETPDAESSEEEADEGVVVTIGEESPPQEETERAPEWVRELRKSKREADRRIRELEEKLQAPAIAETAVDVGAEPTLESAEYDEERFKSEWKAWNKRQADHAEKERKKQEDGAKAQQAWQAKLDAYGKAKTDLKVKDYEDAEATAKEVLNVTQQGIILSGAENPAIVVYALGKNPKKAQELASITDPVKFAFAVARLETQMKVIPRKTAPLPETTVRGNARVSAGIDSTLERLRSEADRTGDRTKVAAYMRQQSQKNRSK